MKTTNYLGAIVMLLAAGCASDSTDGKTAGGQSGTDAKGGYSCDFQVEQPSGDAAELGASLAKSGRSPNQYYDTVEGSRGFSCMNGLRYSIAVVRGTHARTFNGLLNESTPDERCAALQLDAEIHVEALDGSLSYDTSLLTTPLDLGAYTDYHFGARDSDGNPVWIRLQEDREGGHAIDSIYVAYELGNHATTCSLDSGAGGSPDDTPRCGNGGAAD